jgi:hypothetical protein
MTSAHPPRMAALPPFAESAFRQRRLSPIDIVMAREARRMSIG